MLSSFGSSRRGWTCWEVMACTALYRFLLTRRVAAPNHIAIRYSAVQRDRGSARKSFVAAPAIEIGAAARRRFSVKLRWVMNMLRFFQLSFGALAVAAGLGSAEAGEADPRQGPQLVQIALVRPADTSERSFTGVISARVQSNLGFRVPGKVIERLVDVGQTVRAGQPLMRLDKKDLDLALTARENAVVAAKAVATQTTADEERYRRLIANGWSTRQKYEQAKSAVDSANAQLAAAEAQAEIARNERGYSLLLADADGTIVEALAEPGQVVAAGQIVAKLAHAGPREAAVNLPEAVRPAIGSAAQARLYASSSATSPAHLRQLSDAADPASRT